MAKRSIDGRRAIVTGASDGIGRSLAVELGRQGARVVLVARRTDRLRETTDQIRADGGAAEFVAGDVTEAAVRAAAISCAVQSFGGLDLLVNNAGVGATGRFASADSQRMRRVMEVNFFALVEMCRQALPVLRQGSQPMIVNVSSILGHRGIPMMNEYCASKFAVQGFSESIRAELARSGVDVLVVSPGTTETDFFDHLVDGSRDTPWPKQPGVPADVVAAQTVRAIRRGRREIIPNRRGRLLCWLNRLAPRLVDRLMERYG